MSTKPLNRTGAQSRAAEPSHNVWVSANAGTGKTRVLVDRIARLLLDGAKPEKILCLTFTKTGAAEMAERINSQLGEWAMMHDDDLHVHLRVLLNTEPAPDTVEQARKLFAHVLDVPGGLKIRTIHSFCESLIGRFPVEAGVAPHFSVIDERTTTELLNEARERILESTVTNPDTELAKALEHLAELATEDDFTSLMQELSGKRARLAEVVEHFTKQGSVADAVTRLVDLEPSEIDSNTIIATAVTGLDEPALSGAIGALLNGAKTSQSMGEALKDFLANDKVGRAKAYTSLYAPLFLTAAGEPRKKLTTKGAEAAEDDLRAAQEQVLAVMEKLRARATADATIALLGMGQAMIAEYEHLKRIRAHLDYDDLIDKTRALLRGDGAVGWVHYKLDGGIDHILVDESQDTSPEQWDVVKSLAADFYTGLGRHEETDDKPRTVFAVGDEKQSIYSFQGADPYEFGHMREHFRTEVEAVGQRFDSVPLTTSFRTTQAVLRVVDRVFAQPQVSEGLSFDNERVVHDTSRKGEAGIVEVWPTITPLDDPDDEPWDVPVDYKSHKSPELRLADQIADTVQGWLNNGDILTSENRPIRPGDILILVRRRARFAEAMVRALKKRAISVAGADRMVLTNQLAVMDLISAGRFVVMREDDLSMAEVLKSPLVGMCEEAVYDLSYGRSSDLWTELSKRRNETEEFSQAHQVLNTLLGHADFTPPYEFYANLLRDGGRQKLVARLGIDADDPIDEFLNLALDYERTHTPSLQGFLHWVSQGDTQIKRDMETQGDEVRIMTVHGAKGLEAPVVFLTDTCKAPDGRLDAKVQWATHEPAMLWAPYADVRCQTFKMWAEEQHRLREQEYRRLLYVAMTRAKDRLYVTGFEDKTGRSDGCWYDLITNVIKDIGHETDDDTWRYETTQDIPVKDRTAEMEVPNKSPLPAWAASPPPTEETPPQPLTPSRPEPEAPPAFGPFEGDHADRFKRGLLVHKLLETLPSLPDASRRAAAERWLAQPVHDLDRQSQTEIAAETLAVLENPSFSHLFGPDSLAEVSLSGVVDGQVVSARLDRLSVSDEDVIVIDYKTNRPAPTDPNRAPEQYLSQMAVYRQLLAKIYPQRRIRCLLLWTDGPHVMELNDAVLKGYRAS